MRNANKLDRLIKLCYNTNRKVRRGQVGSGRAGQGNKARIILALCFLESMI